MLQKYFPELNKLQLDKLLLYSDLMKEWNAKINLVSRKDIDNFVEHHILHSLSIAKFIKFVPNTKILDIGTGGGLPGIPLAIYFPEVEFLLVDSIAKKIKVVRDITERLEIGNIKSEQIRSENIKGKFDFILGRAVSQIDKFYHQNRKLLSSKSLNEKQNGFIYLKGGNFDEELENIKQTHLTVDLKFYFKEIEFYETKKIIYIN